MSHTNPIPLRPERNLSDVLKASEARTNIGAASTASVTLLDDSLRAYTDDQVNDLHQVVIAGYQPLDSDLTEIAALSTTSYGRALLELANQAALVAAVGQIPISTGVSGLGSGVSTWLATPNDANAATLGLLSTSAAASAYVPTSRTLNALALSANQTFATATTGTDFAITSTGTTHTFSIPDMAASSVTRGLITNGTQTIPGLKTFSSVSQMVAAGMVGTGGTTFSLGSSGLSLSTSTSFNFSSTTGASGTVDGRFIRGGTAIVDCRADSGFRVRNLANSADAPIACSNITSSGTVAAKNILTIGSVQTSSFTAVAGTLHPINLSAVGADLTITMPATPSINDVVGVYITATNASFEAIWNRNGNTMRGGTDVSTFPIWQVGEFFIWQWDGSTWVLIEDGRIAQRCEMFLAATAAGHFINNAYTKVPVDTLVFDNASIGSLANDTITPKRSGSYWFEVKTRDFGTIGIRAARVSVNATTELLYIVNTTTGGHSSTCGRTLQNVSANNVIFAELYQLNGTNLDAIGSLTDTPNAIALIEQLS